MSWWDYDYSNIYDDSDDECSEDIIQRLGLAVINNEFERVRELVEKYDEAVSLVDQENNTILHVAISTYRPQIFHYLLNRGGVPLDVINLNGVTVLNLSLIRYPEFSFELIKKGADIWIPDNHLNTPLHHAVRRNQAVIVKLLIENGADINACNEDGETPIFIACKASNIDMVHMLLYYGADISIPSYKDRTIFDVAATNLPVAIDLLYDFIFDDLEPTTIKLSTLLAIMSSNSMVFPKIFVNIHEIIFDDDDDDESIRTIFYYFPRVKSEYFKLLLAKYSHLVQYYLENYSSLISAYHAYMSTTFDLEPEVLDNLFLLLESDLRPCVIENIHRDMTSLGSFIRDCGKHCFHIETVTELILIILSFGGNIYAEDVNALFSCYGSGILCEIFFFMDIIGREMYRKTHTMPVFMYDMEMHIEDYITNPENFTLVCIESLLKHFVYPSFKQYILSVSLRKEPWMEKYQLQAAEQPDVPRLLQLARDVFRKHFIQRLNIKTSCQFYTLLKQLPVCSFYKKIISLQKGIY